MQNDLLDKTKQTDYELWDLKYGNSKMGKSNQALKAVKYEAHNQNSITNETSPGKRDIQAIHFLPKL